jgi:hypothetical protein
VAFELKHLAAITDAPDPVLEELVATTNEGAFEAPRRRRATTGEPVAAAAPKSAGKRPRQLARLQQALVGTAFEEGGMDCVALAAEWDTDLKEVVVW